MTIHSPQRRRPAALPVRPSASVSGDSTSWQRALVMSVVVAAHAAVVGLLCLAQRRDRPPFLPALEVTLIEAHDRPPLEHLAVAPHRLALIASLPQIPPIPELQVAEPAAVSSPSATEAPSSLAPASAPSPAPIRELSVLCPQRSPPAYPALSRHLHEQGEVRLRVEIDERGQIGSVTVTASSGSRRLDEAARQAVRAWRCQPAEQDGHGVRAVALQSLDFELRPR